MTSWPVPDDQLPVRAEVEKEARTTVVLHSPQQLRVQIYVEALGILLDVPFVLCLAPFAGVLERLLRHGLEGSLRGS